MAEDSAKILIVEDDATIARFVELELMHVGYDVREVRRRRVGARRDRGGRARPGHARPHAARAPTASTVARTIRERGLSDADPHAHGALRDPGRGHGLRRGRRRLPAQAVRDPRAALARPRAAQAHRARPPRRAVQGCQRRDRPGVARRAGRRRAGRTSPPRSTTSSSSSWPTPVVSSAGTRSSRRSGAASTRRDCNVIEVFVCHLRNKIGDKDNQIIRTIRGVGYFFARS